MALLTRTSTQQKAAKIASSLRRSLPRRGLFRQYYPLLGAIWLGVDIAVALVLLFGATIAEYGSVPPKYRVFAIFAVLTMLLVYQWSGLFHRIRMRTLLSEGKILLSNLLIVAAILLGLAYFTDTLRFLSGQLLLKWLVATYFSQFAAHAIVRACMHQARKHSMNIRRALLVGGGSPMRSFVDILHTNPWLGIEFKGYIDLGGEEDPENDSEQWQSGRRWESDGEWQSDGEWESDGDWESDGEWESDDIGVASAEATLESTMEELRAVLSTPAPDTQQETASRYPRLGTIDDVEAVVRSHDIDQVYITVPLADTARVPEVTQRLLKLNVDVNWVPDLSVFYLISHGVRELDGQPILCLSDSPLSTAQGPIKWLEDMLLGSVLLLLAAPLMAVIATAVKLTSPGPVLFVQKRHGLNGEVIGVWKFRTMRIDEGPEMAKQATRNDPRITPIGRFLRRWSLDELPQLFQVLQGRMSIVGPRPHPLWLNDQYTDMLLGYMQRHRVKPGITGWAQVNGWRGETDSPRKMEMRLRHDLYYINHWSLLLDFKVLMMTFQAITERRNAY